MACERGGDYEEGNQYSFLELKIVEGGRLSTVKVCSLGNQDAFFFPKSKKWHHSIDRDF